MKLKLDENLGSRGVELFLQAGHDISIYCRGTTSLLRNRQEIVTYATGVSKRDALPHISLFERVHKQVTVLKESFVNFIDFLGWKP